MKNQFILALDQGTTSSRAILFNQAGDIVSLAQKEFRQIYPQPGWVEHDPQEIWGGQAGVAAEAVAKAGIDGRSIAAIGITNQRETTIVWDRETSLPVYNAIVWQDRRTAEFCDQLKERGLADAIRNKTGLPVDAYFSGSKIKWILDNVPGARARAEAGKLAFGTVDSWLIWNFTHGKVHVTDVSNASRTMLYNIHSQQWDAELLDIMGIPASMLPEVKSSSEVYGHTHAAHLGVEIPIAGVAGDQQAALFGQQCTRPGMVKNTYGTGCFMMMNTGSKPIESSNNLLTTIAWKLDGQVQYALEGSIFIGGAVVKWLRDGLGIIRHSADVGRWRRKWTAAMACIWYRPLPGWVRRTGSKMPAAPLSVPRWAPRPRISPAPRWTALPTRPWTCSRPWKPMPAWPLPSCAWMVVPPSTNC